MEESAAAFARACNSRLRRCASVFLVSTVVVTVPMAGCSSSPRDLSGEMAGRNAGLVATLRGTGSAVTGKVRVVDRGDGVSVMVSGTNLPTFYRVAFHQNGNCSSPNGFSAGPVLTPTGRSPKDLMPLLTNADGNAEAEFHVRGVHTTGENGVAGRSVLLYAGSEVEPVRPGVRNNVVACGVFEPARLLF
jgi:Cu-Zn family superoxide dismutase